MSFPCPSCGHPLTAPAPACPVCRVRLVGADAQRLWQVDQQLAQLQRERGTLLAGLRGPAPAPAGAPSQGLPAGVHHRPAARSWTVQQLLLTGGVALLFVAAIVFVAVAWQRIGTVGQVAVLAVVTASGVVGSRALSRRGLLASAEAVAVLTVGLAVLDAVAVRRYGLFGSDRLEPASYWLVGLPLVALVLAAGAWVVRGSIVFPVATVLALGAWPAALVAALDAEVTGVALIAAGAWAVGAVGALVIARTARRPVLVATAAVGAGWLLLGAQASLVGVATSDPWSHGPPSLGAAAVLLAVLLVVVRRTAAAPAVRAVAAVAAYALTVGLVVAEAHHGGAWALSAVSAVASAAAAAVVVGSVVSALVPLPRGALPAATALVWLSGLVSLTEDDASWPAAGAWLAATALAGAAASRWVHGRARSLATAYAGATTALAVTAFVHGGGDVVRVAVTTSAMVLLVAAAAARRSHREEAGLALGGLVVSATAAAYALTASGRALVLLAVVLGVAGVLSLAYGALPHRGLVAVLGVGLCSAATWSLALDADVEVVEAYSLPLAVLALGAGLVRRHRRPRAPSWTTLGPGLGAGLLPSALASVPDTGLTRPLLTLLAAVSVTALGVRLREQAPVVTGVVASVVVAVALLGPYAVALPRWVSLGLAGALLLAMGFRYEQRRRDALAAAHWLGHLR